MIRDAFAAGTCAALLSGIPSTIYAWLTGGDVMEATRAAGAMLIPHASHDAHLFLAATLVHASVSFFWAAVLTWLLPHRNTTVWAVFALAAIAVLDLRIIGPLFPSIAALAFWPQFADHIAFGLVLGLTLEWRRRKRRGRQA